MHQTFLVKALLETQAAPLIFQYSPLFAGYLLRASCVNECKAFHLVYVSVLSVEAQSFERRLCGPAN